MRRREREEKPGFHLVAPAWGKGFATEAARAIVAFAFDARAIEGACYL